MTTLDTTQGQSGPAPTAPSRRTWAPAASPPDYYYVPLPRTLLADLRDTPLAIGVYSLIGRVFRATKAAVPLSPQDIQHYDPQVSTGAASRALVRLQAAGYLERAPSQGRRNAYRPTWGKINGAARSWDLSADRLGRPSHIAALKLPQDLLDHYLGRLEPHARHGAHITRYVTEPLIGLADVGAYGLVMAGYRASSSALSGLGLLDGSKVRALPSISAALALVSQRRLFDAESPIALTEAGWSQLGIEPTIAPVISGQPLFFMPPAMIRERLGLISGSTSGDQAGSAIGAPTGPVIGESNGVLIADQIGHLIGDPNGLPLGESNGSPIVDQIGSTRRVKRSNTASRSRRSRVGSDATASHGISYRKEEKEPTIQPEEQSNRQSTEQVGGEGFSSFPGAGPDSGQATTGQVGRGGFASSSAGPGSRPAGSGPRSGQVGGGVGIPTPAEPPISTAPAATTEAAGAAESAEPSEAMRELLRIGVRRDVARQLGDRTLGQVQRVIAQAYAQTNVRDLAGWVVSTLRALPVETVDLKALAKLNHHSIADHLGVSPYDRLVWVDRFMNADLIDRPAILAQFHAENPPGQVYTPPPVKFKNPVTELTPEAKAFFEQRELAKKTAAQKGDRERGGLS